MRVLLDECLPRKLGRLLAGHQVMTVPQAGLSGLKNGALLAQAAGRFDVLVTSMPSQQNLQSAGLALVMLVAISNSLEQLAPLVPALLAILPTVVPGQVYCVSSSTTP